MSKKTLTKDEISILTSKGIEGYNELIYRLIAIKDFKKTHKYACKKMDKIFEELLDMSDEDIAMSSYTYAMVEDYESARNCFKVLFEDGDVMKDEKHFDLFASVASALCYLHENDKENANRMLKQALKFKSNDSHFGADEVVLEQAKSLL